jgi:hypothetical protein
MTRKSKREIETTLNEIEQTDVPDNVGPIEQYFSDEYADPPNDELGDAWAEALQPDNDPEE